ncbi:MAG: restriction endonuclease subunit S [Lewinellaceae bacterium]|nr:restriction endonuclease subunit S [Lewinellaceae bacterium]
MMIFARVDLLNLIRKASRASWDFRFNDFGILLLSIPPLPEQTRIAAFLDRKTAQIDQAIAQKERLIELLKERRQILIQNAVTRGLNPNVKMKDSGVDWIGEVPEGWEVKRLKEIFGKPWKDRKEEFMTFEKSSFLSWLKYHESPEIKIFDNDVLMVKTGSTFGKVGIVKNLPQEATINPQLLVFKEVRIHSDFFYALLKTSVVQSQVSIEVIGSTIPMISAETKILNFKIALPPKMK